jgi:hypothetical protein
VYIYRASNDMMKDQLERIWREVVIA